MNALSSSDLSTQQTFTLEQLLTSGLFIVACIVVFLFVARTIVIFASRQFGLYHPEHYAKWPRLPYRPILKGYFKITNWWEDLTKMGRVATGGFAKPLAVLQLLYRKGRNRLLVGRFYALGLGWLMPLSLEIQRHGMLIASSGAGKTTALTTMVSTWEGSAFIIDPKSQIWNALIGRDNRRWYKIAPYSKDSHCWNFFDDIKAAIEREGVEIGSRWAYKAGEALITVNPNANNPFFAETAKSLIPGLILHIISREHPDNHNPAYLYKLLQFGYRIFNQETGIEETTAKDAKELLLRLMRKNSAFNDAVSGSIAGIESASDSAAGDVLATALSQLKWLAVQGVQNVVSKTTIPPLSELKSTDDYVLEFDAPILSIRQELAPFLRLLSDFVIYTFETPDIKKNGQTLGVIDELPSIELKVLDVAIPVLRSMGLSVLGATQDLEILQKAHPKSWEGFLGNADFVICAGTNHDTTAEYISRVLGKVTIQEKDPTTGRKSRQTVEVATPDQIKRFLFPKKENIIILRNGERAIKAKDILFFRELPFWKFNPDTEHKETFLRRLARSRFDNKNVPDTPKQT